LTESLREALGTRQGAEVLSQQLGVVYSALIAEVEKYGGSVIGFAGDSILCWFDIENDEGGMKNDELQASSSNALSAAMGMQRVIQEFPALALKVSIASGNARRFVVGDEEIQRIDVLAGGTVARTATGEHLAKRGDVLVDEVTAKALGGTIEISEWREDSESKERCAVIEGKMAGTEKQNIFGAETQTVTPAMQALRPYLHKEVYYRETSEQGQFLTEFRPCVALFIRFTGIDYETDDAQMILDRFVQNIQKNTERYDGVLLQLTIGDKGSYAYVNFGALSAHEDDSRRAVKTALELRNKTDLQLQMGISQGVMRVGAYGGETRQTFGALGDDVNLAARLMTTAAVDEILLSSHVHKAVINDFTFEPRPPLPMKGKAEPLLVFAVTGESQQRAVRLQEPNYSLPMVGREKELGIINAKLDAAAKGQGQAVAIVAEAGMGKSRLVAEVIRSARRRGFVGFGGVCQSDGIHTPYLAWKSILQAFFDVDHEMPLKRQIRLLEGDIEDRAPSRVNAMPLLNVVLDLNVPENDFTNNLEPKIRQSALHALLEDCLKAQTKDEPTLIVIEDLHWIDASSYDLLEGLAKALANHAACFVLAYRPSLMERLQSPRIEVLPQFTRVELHELTKAEAESAIRAKMVQLYPARDGALPDGLVDALMAHAQGNPFYLEELLNYVRDRGLDPTDLNRIELPDSLHTLILSRIDQLSKQEKTTLRVASIIGRLFRAKWLTGYYPELGSFSQVKASLDALDLLDITLLGTPAQSPQEGPELIYLFKHIVTHEVTYESLSFATRARLHEQLARYLENADAPVDTIAFHYGRSENVEKQREFFRKAGEAAQKNFANNAALEYYGMLLPILKDTKEQTQIHLKRGDVYELIGKYDEAEGDYRAALDSAKDDIVLKASAQFALGKLNCQRGDYKPALDWLEGAKEVRAAIADTVGLAQVLIEIGMVLNRKGEYVQAREPLNEGLVLAQRAGDKLNTALALNILGHVAHRQGDYPTAKALYEESLVFSREMGDKQSTAALLDNLGVMAMDQGDYPVARALHEESLALRREMGHKGGIAASLNNPGNVAMAQGDYLAARALYEESLALLREMGNKWGIAITLNNLGGVALAQGNYVAARALHEENLALSQEMDDKTGIAYALLNLGLVDLVESKLEARKHILNSLRLRQEMGEQQTQTSSLIGAAGLAMHGGNHQFATQLLGAVQSALKALDAQMEPELKNFHGQTLAAAREALGDSAFQFAWEKGSQWSLEEAVERALEDSDE